MPVHKKLMEARIKLQNTALTKSGNNKFAGYKYFELGDFLPAVQQIFNDLGLCGVVSFGTETATLEIRDTEDDTALMIFSPMSSAALKGCHEVQNLGAVQTYLRRYLWVTAMEIVEHDALDSSEPLKPDAKPVSKTVSNAPASAAWENMPPAKKPTKPVLTSPMDSTAWKITLKDHEADGWEGAVVEGANMALGLATKPDDVVQIFKVNRELLDRLSAEAPQKHAELVAKFGETKTKLQGEVNV